MQISSRFTIAVHVLIAIETFKNDHKITSEFLASSANVNPTVIRRLLQQLKKAEIVTVKRGSGGADIEILDGDNASGCLQCRGACRKWTVVSFP